MADVYSVEEVLQNFCDCVFEVIDSDSTLNGLPQSCCDFLGMYEMAFPKVTEGFSADAYHKVVFYIEDSFNDYINKIIQNNDASVLRFNPDNVSDMVYLLKESYSQKAAENDFPEKTFLEIGLLISQKFRAFKNAVLFNRNITKNQTEAVTKIMHNYQQEVINAVNTVVDENRAKAETAIEENRAKAELAINKVQTATLKTIAASERKSNETSIGILGVFSAIVLVFNAAVSFYTSAFNAFTNASIYKTLTVLLVISIVVICALMGLFYYLDRVRKSAQSDTDKYFLKTISEASASNGDGSVQTEKKMYILDKTEGKGSVFKSLLPFLITLVILISGLVAVLFLWRQGYVETRNKVIADSLAQTTSVTTVVSE